MRIISGLAKGTRLAKLKGQTLRPTLDRVKESVFSRIMPDLPGSRFLDLFAGTGGNGLEAISRGADLAVFVESNANAQALIRENLKTCRFPSERWQLLESDAIRAIKSLNETSAPFDFVYVDPPFDANLYDPVLAQLAASSIVSEDSIVMVEHASKQALNDKYDKLALTDTRRTGDTSISWFMRE